MATAVEPSNLEAEESVLGACLLSGHAVDKAGEFLEPSHFYRETHGAIFGALLSLRRREEPTEPLAVAAELERLGTLASVGGRGRLAELVGNVTAASNVGHYAALVLESARSRMLYRAASALQRASLNGGVTFHPELLDDMQHAMEEARQLPGEPGIPAGPLFLSAHDFASRQFAPPEPLLGSEAVPILAVGSFNLLAGRPGAGKTTLLLDMACHLAAGVPWPPRDSDKAPPPWDVPRALRIALIENEGPQESFRGKLEQKLKTFPHSIREAGGCLMIQAAHWGTFSFADRNVVARTVEALDEHEIDLVMGDPLASLGLEGVGSPKETLDFVNLLKPLGLGANRAFLFLHHFRERIEKGEDEMRRISGAWGGHLDTLLSLAATHSEDQLRLAYPKIRWARTRTPHPVILVKIYNTVGFEAIAEEGDAALLEPKVYQALVEGRATARGLNGWQKIDDIRELVEGRRTDVKKALEGAPHLFTSVTGEAAKEMGAKSVKAILWGLVEWGEAPALDAEGDWQEQLDSESLDGFAPPTAPDDTIPF